MEVSIHLARPNDLLAYTKLLQQTYQDAYVNEEIGLTKDCFSKAIFDSPDTQEYLVSNLVVNAKQKCWLAFFGEKLVGSISIIERNVDCELRGFYVATAYQGKGIGRKLWEKARVFAKKKDITCDIYAHNTKTIAMYKKWGFVIDTTKPSFCRHWPEWPEGVEAQCMYMHYSQK